MLQKNSVLSQVRRCSFPTLSLARVLTAYHAVHTLRYTSCAACSAAAGPWSAHGKACTAALESLQALQAQQHARSPTAQHDAAPLLASTPTLAARRGLVSWLGQHAALAAQLAGAARAGARGAPPRAGCPAPHRSSPCAGVVLAPSAGVLGAGVVSVAAAGVGSLAAAGVAALADAAAASIAAASALLSSLSSPCARRSCCTRLLLSSRRGFSEGRWPPTRSASSGGKAPSKAGVLAAVLWSP